MSSGHPAALTEPRHAVGGIGRLAVNSSVLTAGAYLAQIATIASYWFAARHLAPGLFGPLLGAIGLALLSATATDFGINALTVRTMVADDGNVEVFAGTFTAKVLLAVLLGAVWAIGGVLFSLIDRDGLQYLPLAAYVSLMIVSSTLSVPFRANQDMKKVALIGIVEKLVAMIATLATFFFLRPGIPLFLTASLALGAASSSLFAAYLAREKYLLMTRPSLTQLWALWKSSVDFGIAGLASQIQRADVAIVAIAAGPVAAGIYGAPARITGALGVMPTAFSQVIFPHVAAVGDRRKAYKDAIVGGLCMVGVMTVVLMVAYVLAPTLTAVALGGQYMNSTNVLRVILVAMVLASINAPLSVVLQAERQEAFVGRVVASASLVGLLAVAVGAATAGAIGASFGFLILQIVLCSALVVRFVAVYQASAPGLAEA